MASLFGPVMYMVAGVFVGVLDTAAADNVVVPGFAPIRRGIDELW